MEENLLRVAERVIESAKSEIYLNLKLRGLEEKYDVVKVAVVDCNPETLQLIEQQLSQIGYVEPVVFPLGRMKEIAPKLNEDYDMILTTTTHFRDVEPYVQGGQILAMMSMTLDMAFSGLPMCS